MEKEKMARALEQIASLGLYCCDTEGLGYKCEAVRIATTALCYLGLSQPGSNFRTGDQDEPLPAAAGGDLSNPRVGTKVEDHLEQELKDPEFAFQYLMAAVELKDQEYLKAAVERVVKRESLPKCSGRELVLEETVAAIDDHLRAMRVRGEITMEQMIAALKVISDKYWREPKEETLPKVASTTLSEEEIQKAAYAFDEEVCREGREGYTDSLSFKAGARWAEKELANRETPQDLGSDGDDEKLYQAALKAAQALYRSNGAQDIHRATCLRWVFLDGVKWLNNRIRNDALVLNVTPESLSTKSAEREESVPPKITYPNGIMTADKATIVRNSNRILSEAMRGNVDVLSSHDQAQAVLKLVETSATQADRIAALEKENAELRAERFKKRLKETDTEKLKLKYLTLPELEERVQLLEKENAELRAKGDER